MKIEKQIVYFIMIKHPCNGWIRVGKVYSEKETAKGWVSFVKKAWHGLPAKILQCRLTYIDGILDKKSNEKLDKFNIDPP